MAHYAFLSEDSIVTEVIVGKDEFEDGMNWEEYYGNLKGQVCKRTSYNTRANIHTASGTPFRKNYAGIGYTYDETLDAFIPPRNYTSWILNTETGNWDAPVAYPDLTDSQIATWNEEALEWNIIDLIHD